MRSAAPTLVIAVCGGGSFRDVLADMTRAYQESISRSTLKELPCPSRPYLMLPPKSSIKWCLCVRNYHKHVLLAYMYPDNLRRL